MICRAAASTVVENATLLARGPDCWTFLHTQIWQSTKMKVVLTCCVCRLLQGGAGVGRHQLDGQRRVFGSDREGKRVESWS